jgi:poly(beta-D-mannuronate) lyase
VRGLKNTFSEKIIIKNSLFRAISADAINFAGEKDDAGKYNVEELIIENCSFNRILGLGINVYRGGSDESTAGPEVNISNCTFEDVCNKERGSVVKLIGAQVLNISGCNFSNSGRGGVSIRLDEATFEKVKIRNCNFWNSGRILTMTNKVVEGEMSNIKPEYEDAAKFDYRSIKSNQLYIKKIGVR